MRRLIAVMLLMLLTVGAFSVVFVSAQDSTATPEPTADPNQPVTTIRILHLSPDGPTLVPYVNGAPSNIQLLTYPSSSGWVEVPGGSFALSLIPQGAAQSQAVVGPVTITSADSWSTIVVVGSAANGTLQAYNVRENVGAIAEGCARVTVFHAIEDAPAVDVVTDDGTVLASGLGFPGGEMASGGERTMLEGCGQDLQVSAPTSATAESTADATVEATPDASENTTPEAETRDDDTEASFTLNPGTGALSCRALVADVMTDTTTDAEATSDATTEATADATPGATEEAADEADTTNAVTRGQSFNNCGYTFDVPAGTFNLSVVGSGGGSTILDLSGTTLEADTYYFVAAVGTAAAPQVFLFTIAGERLGGLLAEDVTAEASPVATEDVTAEPTVEATIEPTTEPTVEATEEPTVEATVDMTATVELTPVPSVTATP